MKEKLGYKRKLTPTSLTILDPAGLWVFVKLRVRTFLRLIEGLPPDLQSSDRRFAFRTCSRLSGSVPVEIDLSPIGDSGDVSSFRPVPQAFWMCPSADPRGQVKNMFDRSIGSLVLLNCLTCPLQGVLAADFQRLIKCERNFRGVRPGLHCNLT
jgi:hypothetical protein